MNRFDKLSSHIDFHNLSDDSIPVSPISPEEDLPPEYCTYKDEGCELFPACLECPLPQCALELTWRQVKESKTTRNQEIRRCYIQEKKSVAELMQLFHVSLRTIRRALKDN